MSDPMTLATADQLIDVHGSKAVAVAENAIDRFARRGDQDGERIWRDVLAAVCEQLKEIEPDRPRRRA